MLIESPMSLLELHVLSHHLTAIDTLDSLEQVEHFPLTDSAISVLVTLLHSVPHISLVLRRSHTHLQTEVAVGSIELLSLELTCAVHVVSLIDHLDFLVKHLVVHLAVPSS